MESTSRVHGILALILAACATACATTKTEGAPAATAREAGPTSRWRDIERCEDQRSLGEGEWLLGALRDADPRLRARAATAIGRLKFPVGGTRAGAALIDALRDPEVSVRASAAFALGMREDRNSLEALLAHAADPNAEVRARVFEAASKLGAERKLAAYLTGFNDPEAAVRLEAYAGCARLPQAKGDASDAAGIADLDRALVDCLGRETDLAALRYGLFALERRKAAAARTLFEAHAASADFETRLNAVRGLAGLAGRAPVADALIAVLSEASGGDGRVAVEALRGLARTLPEERDRVLAALPPAFLDRDHHVRAAAVEALRALEAAAPGSVRSGAMLTQAFEAARFDPSAAVRAARAMAWSPAEAREPELDVSPHVNAATLRALGRAGSLRQLLAFHQSVPRSLLTEGVLLEVLGTREEPEAAERVVAALADTDMGLRLSALTALLEQDKPRAELAAVEDCWRSAQGEVSTEVRFNALRLAVKIGGGRARGLLEAGRLDPDAFVRQVACAELAKLSGGDGGWIDRPLPAVELAPAGMASRPRVRLVTELGELDFELFADEAPQHVHSFLTKLDSLSGTTFHRVVSDFVAQGGDARGDGNGGASWRGDSLRHEIGPRKYVRGSLGMPRNEDWDSGGSQIFITHRATPHLDGRYTIFGELKSGFDVLDRLDLGTRILTVRRLP